MRAIKTTAKYDEECVECGYPFDAEDACLISEGEEYVYCSRACERTHTLRMSERMEHIAG